MPRKRARTAMAEAAIATPERLARASGAIEDVTVRVEHHEDRWTKRFLDGSPIALMHKRKEITQDEYQAASKLYTHWYYSGLSRSGVVDPTREPVDGGGPRYESDTQLFHRQKFQKAIQALGMTYSPVISGIVLDERPMAQYRSRNYRDKTARTVEAMTMLRLGLDVLYCHFFGPRKYHRPQLWTGPGHSKPRALSAEERAALQASQEAAEKARQKAKRRKAKRKKVARGS